MTLPVDTQGPALTQGTVTWTHGQLRARVHETSALLEAPGPRLVFLNPRNDLASVVALLAARRAGHVVALFDPASTPARRQALVERYLPTWEIETRADRPADAPLSADELRTLPSPAHPLHPELALLLSTSGSTGSPRLVRLSARAVDSNAAAIAQVLEITPDSRALLTLPLHYSFGLSVLNSQLEAGASVVLAEGSPAQREFWTTLAEQGCTTWAAVPYGMELFLRLGGTRLAPPTLRELLTAGGHLARPTTERLGAWLAERGGRLFRMYGQTEATARIAVVPAELSLSHPDAAGRAIPGGQLLIDDGQGPSAVPGRLGEVVYRGPNVMMGYAEGPADLAEGDQLGGELRTGDLGVLDEAGLLYLRGRLRRFAKVHGVRVALDEAEARLHALLSLRAVHPVSLVAMAGDDRVVVHGEWPADLDLAELRITLANELRLHPSTVELRRRAPLPRLPNGKLDHAALEVER